MKKGLEADLDPPGTRRTRPGGKAAEQAIEDSKKAAKPRKRGEPGRPGSSAAARAVESTKGKGRAR